MDKKKLLAAIRDWSKSIGRGRGSEQKEGGLSVFELLVQSTN